MDAKELEEYKRRLRLREQRRAAVRWAVGFSDQPGRGSPHPKARGIVNGLGHSTKEDRLVRDSIGKGT